MASTVGKLKRSAHLLYVDTAFDVDGSSPSWFLVGKHVEDLSVELNPALNCKINSDIFTKDSHIH